MTSDTANKLKALMDSIEQKVSELTKLEIRTVVGSFQPAGGKPDGALTATGPVHVLHTTVDLLDGDIQTEIDEWFLAEERKPLVDMHLQRERQGGEIVRANVEAIKSLWTLAGSLLKGDAKDGGQ
jgi:hypothetical protein